MPDTEIEIIRRFDAPRPMVFDQWLDAAAIAEWFPPEGWRTVSATMDGRPGGVWRASYQSMNGDELVEYGEVRELRRYDRIVLTLTQIYRRTPGPETTIVVSFEEVADGTLMTFRQTGFDSIERRDGNEAGWRGCLDKLQARVRRLKRDETELRQLHEDWFVASARKDIEASMALIADDVVSYEHGVPAQYHGIDAVRAVCQEGFDQATGDFEWTAPDLRIVVDGDLAVAWGLNHMQANEGGQTTMDMWSRGTRVFRRRDGRWQMIHQHVSFPFDPASGKAVFDAGP